MSARLTDAPEVSVHDRRDVITNGFSVDLETWNRRQQMLGHRRATYTLVDIISAEDIATLRGAAEVLGNVAAILAERGEPGVADTLEQMVTAALHLRAAVEALTTEEEGAAFMAAYRKHTPHAVENVGYVAGYYDRETMRRIHRLTGTVHPFSGSHEPTPEEAFEAGNRWGRTMLEEAGEG